MAILRNQFKVILIHDDKDGDAYAYFREPTNEEWDKYQRDRFVIKTRGKKIVSNRNNDVKAKAQLFDKILEKVENLKDASGKEYTLEQCKKLIPDRMKAEAVFVIFEQEGAEEADGENQKN